MTKRPINRPESTTHRSLLLLLSTAAFLYWASSALLVGSNDGAHFASTRAIVRHGTVALGDGAILANVDVGRDVQGRLHANRPVGTALLFAPAYAIGLAAPAGWFGEVSAVEKRWYEEVEFPSLANLGFQTSRASITQLHQTERPMQFACQLLAIAFGVASLWLSSKIAHGVGISDIGSLAYVAALAFCTIHWRYSTVMFSHLPAQTLLLLSIVCLINGFATNSALGAFAFGLVNGLCVLVEYQSLITVPVVGVWFALAAIRSGKRWDWPGWWSAGAGIGFVGVAIAWMHWHWYGSPLKTPMSASVYFDYTHNLKSMFGANPLRGAYSLYFSSYVNGLCHVSRMAIVAGLGWVALAFLGIRRLAKTNSMESDQGSVAFKVALIALIVTVHSVLMFFIECPYGGETADHRYLVRVLPLIMLPIGFVVDSAMGFVASTGTGIRTMMKWLFWIASGTLALRDATHIVALQARFMKHKAWLPVFWVGRDHPTDSSAREILTAAFPAVANPTVISFAFLMAGLVILVGMSLRTPVAYATRSELHHPGDERQSSIDGGRNSK